jgi:hypothetical protein
MLTDVLQTWRGQEIAFGPFRLYPQQRLLLPSAHQDANGPLRETYQRWWPAMTPVSAPRLSQSLRSAVLCFHASSSRLRSRLQGSTTVLNLACHAGDTSHGPWRGSTERNPHCTGAGLDDHDPGVTNPRMLRSLRHE